MTKGGSDAPRRENNCAREQRQYGGHLYSLGRIPAIAVRRSKLRSYKQISHIVLPFPPSLAGKRLLGFFWNPTSVPSLHFIAKQRQS